MHIKNTRHDYSKELLDNECYRKILHTSKKTYLQNSNLHKPVLSTETKH